MPARVCYHDQLPSAIEYRRVPEFPRHFVGSDGSVWKFFRMGWVRLGTYEQKKGRYLRVALCHQERRLDTFVHSLILQCFVGPRPDGQVCRHLDGDPQNNTPGNLAWGTHSQNQYDRTTHGRTNHGEKNSNAKLDEAKVRAIRDRRAAGEKLTSIASDYGIDFRTVSEICLRRRWTKTV